MDTNEIKAAQWFEWYAAHAEELAYYVGGAYPYDHDAAITAAMRCRDAVAAGADVKSNTAYYLQAYRSVYLNAQRQVGRYTATPPDGLPDVADDPTPDVDADARCAELAADVLAYVRDNYNLSEAAIYEVYVGLLPDTSYQRMAAAFGLPVSRVRAAVSAIRADIRRVFGQRRLDCLNTL
jgi:DNA-directed RNA polymerase specialized sigma24 family protein